MTVCDLCKGTGRLLEPWFDTTGLMTRFTGDICFMCDGKGTIGEPMTNEEWFDTLSTKEKAKWLDKVAENCCQICDEENRELCRGNIATGCKFENAKKWELWLKQPHTPIT